MWCPDSWRFWETDPARGAARGPRGRIQGPNTYKLYGKTIFYFFICLVLHTVLTPRQRYATKRSTKRSNSFNEKVKNRYLDCRLEVLFIEGKCLGVEGESIVMTTKVSNLAIRCFIIRSLSMRLPLHWNLRVPCVHNRVGLWSTYYSEKSPTRRSGDNWLVSWQWFGQWSSRMSLVEAASWRHNDLSEQAAGVGWQNLSVSETSAKMRIGWSLFLRTYLSAFTKMILVCAGDP